MYKFLHPEASYRYILLYALFWKGLVPYNDPAWFFIVLAEVLLADYILNQGNRKEEVQTAGMVVAFLLGYYVYTAEFFLPFGLNRALLGFGFFTAGRLLGGGGFSALPKGALISITLTTMMFWVATGSLNNIKVSMYIFSLGNYWIFVISGLCGSLTLMSLCRLIEDFPGTKKFVHGMNAVFF